MAIATIPQEERRRKEIKFINKAGVGSQESGGRWQESGVGKDKVKGSLILLYLWFYIL
jgi:hypothetical protein